MESVFLLLWLSSIVLFPSSNEASCVLDDFHGEVSPENDSFHIKWKIDYGQDYIDVFLSSADESLLNSRQGYLAFGLSEVHIIGLQRFFVYSLQNLIQNLLYLP